MIGRKRRGGFNILPLFVLAFVVCVICLSNPISVRSNSVSGDGENILPRRLYPFQTLKLPELEAEHYTFLGWKDISTGEYVDSIKWGFDTLFGHALYAEFEPESFAIRYHDENGKLLAEDEYYYGIGTKLPTACSDNRYYVGWIDDSGNVFQELPMNETGELDLTVLFADAKDNRYEKCDIYTGPAGTITIGDTNTTLYSAQLVYGDDQEITDGEHIANDFWQKNMKGRSVEIICDHAYQGFRAIMSSPSAFITRNGETKEYECIHRHQGYNTGDDLIMINDKSALNQYDDADIIMYTCNDMEGYSISITWWKLKQN